jgi:alpha-ketoglutarate-dependent taurine dioxygenase
MERTKLFAGSKRRTLNLEEQDGVTTELLLPASALPLAVRPALNGLDLPSWANLNRQFLEERLLRHGALLFRGFEMGGLADFERFTRAVSDEVLAYKERSSPRTQVGDRVYTSTDYPADQSIYLHNEHSYSHTFPRKLFFFCNIAPDHGGETPIADTRKVFQAIAPGIRKQFEERRWMYVRNFGDGFGLSWQEAFQTQDRADVDRYCREADISCEWKPGDRLRTSQVRNAVTRHPETGDWVWFNHAVFFHITTLEPNLRRQLLAQFSERDLPNNTYFGDGGRIDDSILDELRAAWSAATVVFPWQRGDVLWVDNMLAAHGRNPFSGRREILVAMAQPWRHSS